MRKLQTKHLKCNLIFKKIINLQFSDLPKNKAFAYSIWALNYCTFKNNMKFRLIQSKLIRVHDHVSADCAGQVASHPPFGLCSPVIKEREVVVDLR